MKKTGCFLVFFSLVTFLHSQPSIQWQTTLGGSLYDEARAVQQTTDGGYFITGHTVSDNGDVVGNHGYNDFWAIKMDSFGMVQWKKAYGGSNHEWVNDGQPTSDGGYVLTGFTESNDGEVSGNHGDKDMWVVKLDSDGNIEWQKCLGGTNWDEAWDILQTPEGGYILAGISYSTDGDVSGNHGASDYWIVKLSPTADIEWQKCLGGSDYDDAYTITLTNEGGYIIAGESQSTDGDVEGNSGGLAAWVVKLNFEGKIEWQRALGGSGLDRANEILQTREGGYVICGQTSSDDGDVVGNHGGYDLWVVKLDEIGGIEWQKALGGTNEDYGQGIHQTNDGGFVAIGFVHSTNGDVTGNHGSTDLWIVKLTEEGGLQWQKAFGGTLQERGYSIKQTSDEGYILAGEAWSNNGDVTGVLGKTDIWIVKLSPESSPTTEFSSSPLQIFPNPAHHSISLQIPTQESSANVIISDLLGRECSRQTISIPELSAGSLNITALYPGFYLVTATTSAGKIFSGKFWKE